MRRLHRYILFNFLNIFLFSIIFTMLLFFLSDFFGHLSSLLKSSVGVYSIVKYYFYYMPFVIYYFMPLIFALSSLVTLGFMSMRNEIIVMRSSGINILKIALPIFFLSILFSVFMFLADEFVVGKSLDRAYFIKTFEFNKNYGRNIWLSKSNLFINVDYLNINKKTASNVKIYKLAGNGIQSVIYAKKLKIEDKSIILKDVRIENVKNLSKEQLLDELKMDVELKNSDFVKSPEKSDYTIGQLWKGIKGTQNSSYYLSIFMSKVFYPFSTVILSLLSLVFVLKITPRKSDFVKNVFLGGVMFIVYIGIFELLISMGKLSIIQPALVVVFIALWIVISIYNLLKLGF